MMSRVIPLLAFIALAFLLFVGVRMNSGRDTSAIPSPLIGKSAPALNLPELDMPQQSIHLQDLKGRAYVLNIWGSWCVSCRIEHPIITDMAKQGVTVVGYNYKDSAEDARAWLNQFGNPYSLIIQDEDGKAALDWGIYGAPETFIISAQGIVLYKHVGPLTTEIVQQEILPLLKDSP
jgi:cytochrome c biogenesis protein CcmG/thiol:disulfide interchange protein DsbE